MSNPPQPPNADVDSCPVAQIGVATVHYGGSEAAPSAWASEISQDGIACVPLGPLVADMAQSGPVYQALRPLSVTVHVERAAAGKIRVLADLRCAPGDTLKPVDALDRCAISATWAVQFGWNVRT